MQTFKSSTTLPPPLISVGVIGWLHKNLFSSFFNTVLTLGSLYLLYITVPPIIQWAFIDADWFGDSREACTSDGACWVFVSVRFSQFIYGFYPPEAYWRVNLAFILLALLVIALLIDNFPFKGWISIFTLVGYPIIAFYLFYGGIFGLEVVETHKWGGLTLTLI